MDQAKSSTSSRPWRQRLVSSALSLGVRQGLVAALTAGGVLVLSHILRPAQFAFFGWTTSVATIASAVGDFGLGAALIHSGRARELAGDAITRHLRVALPLTVLAWVVIALLPLSGPVQTAAALLSLSAALLGAQMLPTSVFEAEGRFAFIGAIEVAQRALLIGGAVALAAIFHSSWAAPVAALGAAAFGWLVALGTSGIRRREPTSAHVDAKFARSWITGRVANHLNYAVYPIIGTAFLTGHQLGLVLWALQVSAVPALGGQVAARILFPAMVGDRDAQGATHRRAVLVLCALGGPIVSAMIVFASPLTKLVFGATWLGAVTVLQLECFNTLLGLILTPTAPAMYLLAPPATVRRLMMIYTALTTVLAVVLIGPVGLTAISIATACSTTVILVVFDLLLRRQGHGGLAFSAPIVAVIVASFAVAFFWTPPVANLPLLALEGIGWALGVFGLVIAICRPPIPWDRLNPLRGRDLRCA